MVLPMYVSAQDTCTFTFSGRVTDAETRDPLPFATVLVKELNTGAVADEKGRFKVEKLCPGTYTFVCSFLGYTSFTYKATVSGNTVNNFPLQPDVTAIDEVIVKGQREE